MIVKETAFFLVVAVISAVIAISGIIIMHNSSDKGEYPKSKKGKTGLLMAAIGIVMMIGLFVLNTNIPPGSVGIGEDKTIYSDGNYFTPFMKIEKVPLSGVVAVTPCLDLRYMLDPKEIDATGEGIYFLDRLKEVTIKDIYLDNGTPIAVLENVPRGIESSHLSVMGRLNTSFLIHIYVWYT